MTGCIRRARSGALTVLLLLLSIAPLAAQTPVGNLRLGMRTGIGYTGALPEAQLGLGLFRMIGTSGAGVFADAKMTFDRIDGHPDYCPTALATCDVAWVQAERNDIEVRQTTDWVIFNAGVMYAITPELAILGGAGIAKASHYREYFIDDEDPDAQITPSGAYFVDDPSGTGTKLNIVGGAMLRAGRRLAFRVGYETAPGGMSLGGYIVFGR